MQVTLRPYQEAAIQRMIENPYHYLAFDMGLGKTLTVLEYLYRTKQKAIIFAPLLVAQNTWPAEIRKWGYNMSYAFVHGRHKQSALESGAQVLITNYATVKWLYDYGLEHGGSFLRNRVVVFDEATAFKRASSQRFKMLQAMQHLFKCGVFNLSGEPMPDGFLGLWSQYWMLDRGKALGQTMSVYKGKYFIDSGPPRWICRLKNPWFAEEIKGLIAHETSVLRAEDYIGMPEALYQDVRVRLDPNTMAAYRDFVRTSVIDLEGECTVADTAGVLSNKLRQFVQGAMYDEDGNIIRLHTHKMDVLAELVDNLQGSPAICAINFLFELDHVRKTLNYDVPCIHGKTPLAEKQKILAKWDKREIPLLLCHPASLSHGLNMQTGGNTIIWLSLPWSLEQYKQLNGRLIRPGQTKPVRVMHIVAQGTIDEKVASVLAKKDATQEDFKFDLRLLPSENPT